MDNPAFLLLRISESDRRGIVHIERAPNRNSPPAALLRQSYREGGKVRKRTLVNVSKLPDETVEGLRILLKGGQAIQNLEDPFEVIRSRPHGLVAAVLGTLRDRL